MATLQEGDYITDERGLYQVVGENSVSWFVEDCSAPSDVEAPRVRVPKDTWESQSLWRGPLRYEVFR